MAGYLWILCKTLLPPCFLQAAEQQTGANPKPTWQSSDIPTATFSLVLPTTPHPAQPYPKKTFPKLHWINQSRQKRSHLRLLLAPSKTNILATPRICRALISLFHILAASLLLDHQCACLEPICAPLQDLFCWSVPFF